MRVIMQMSPRAHLLTTGPHVHQLVLVFATVTALSLYLQGHFTPNDVTWIPSSVQEQSLH